MSYCNECKESDNDTPSVQEDAMGMYQGFYHTMTCAVRAKASTMAAELRGASRTNFAQIW